tara:strand:+ start:26 stop:2170 length:2145 start_codon:yes stop_codon:yes gene_type:complete
MAQYNKSFNFKNGLQVDNDNFIVNASGLVGIGSTIPTAHLDVKGSTVVSENITVGLKAGIGSLTVAGVSTFHDYLHVGSGVSAVGVITASSFSGDGSYLSNIVGFSTTKFILEKAKGAPAGPNYGPSGTWGSVENTGLATGGYDLRNTTDKMLSVGIGTNRGDWGYDLIIGVNPENNKYETSPMYYGGIGFNGIQGGSLKATGIITAVSGFVGPGTSIIELDANNIAHNTISNARLPVIDNSKFPTLTRIGVGVTDGISVGTLEAKYIDLTGSAGPGPSQPHIGIASATVFVGLHTGNVEGDLTGNADTATTLLGNSSVNTSGKITALTGFVGGAVSFTSAGIGTASSFSGDLQVQNGGGTPGDDGNVDVFFSSYNNETTIAIGRSEVIGDRNAVIRYNNTATGWWDKDRSNSLDIANYSQGNINFVSNPSLVSGASSEGVFSWRKGANTAPTMVFDPTLGRLGIGVTEPEVVLHVTGISTFNGAAQVIGALRATSLTLDSNFVGSLNGSVYSTDGTALFLDKGTNDAGANAYLKINSIATSGISTFADVMATGGIGIKTDPNAPGGENDNHLLTLNPKPRKNVDAGQSQFIVNNIGQVAIKTSTFYLQTGLQNPLTPSYFRMIGVGRTPGSAVDFGIAGNSPEDNHETELIKTRFMIPPTVTDAQRGLLRDITNNNSSILPDGALIYNSDKQQLQMYHRPQNAWIGIGTAWGV